MTLVSTRFLLGRILLLPLLFFWIVSAVNAQNQCSISGSASGKLYSSKSDAPIDCFRPQITGNDLVYDTQSSIAESESQTTSLKHVVMFVGNSWFMAFDKKDSLCSQHSIFSQTDGEHNFIALMKNNDVIRRFVPDKYLVRGQSNRYSAFENSFKQGSPELIKGEDIVFYMSQLSRQEPMVTIHVPPGELKNYQNRIIEILSKPVDGLPLADANDPEETEADTNAETTSPAEDEKPVAEKVDEPKVDLAAREEPEMTHQEKLEAEKAAKKAAKLAAKEEKRRQKELAAQKKIEDKQRAKDEIAAKKEAEKQSEEKESDQNEEVAVKEEPVKEAESKPVTKDQEPEQERTMRSENPDTDLSVTASNETEPTSSGNLGAREIPEEVNAISESDREEISQMAAVQIEQLGVCFKTMVDRNVPSHIKKQKRENSVETLFVNDKAEVSVSSVNQDELSYYFITEYLERLETMYYQRVEIDFSDIHKVTDLKKNPDGTWSGTVTFSQIFKGFANANDVNPVYGDITHKNVTIVVKRVETYTGGTRPDVNWIVLLGDIGVNQTQKI